MPRYAIAIDAGRCVGCYNCFLTCRDEFAGNAYPGYSAPQPMSGGNWIKVKAVERGKYPHVKVNHMAITCCHCDDASCVRLDPTGAVYRRADGIVIIDPEKAKGNKDITKTCPYRVIEWNEELSLPQKCTMCAHLLDAGDRAPRCVESCPSGALVFGDLDDPDGAVSKIYASGAFKPLSGEFRMREKNLYKGLPGKFVAGNAVYGDIDEVAAGAAVTLIGDGFERGTVTNGFGDFEFEDLPANTAYTVRLAAEGYGEAVFKVNTMTDVYIGDIRLTK